MGMYGIIRCINAIQLDAREKSMKNRSVYLALAAVAFAFPGLVVADTVDADALSLAKRGTMISLR